MLATLNLQLSPVELLDDTNFTPIAPLPGDTGTATSGFADLLSLPVDVASQAEYAGGALLPQGGSNLPFDADSVQSDALRLPLPTLRIDPELRDPTPGTILDGAPVETLPIGVQADVVDPALRLAAVDLELESLVAYPTAHPVGDTDSDTLSGKQTLPASLVPIAQLLSEDTAVRREQGGATQRSDTAIPGLRLDARAVSAAATPVPTPVVEGPEALTRNVAGEVVAPAHLGLRERGQTGDLGSRAAPIVITEATIDGEKRVPLTDPARRLDFASLQRMEGLPKPTSDLPQSRLAVAQPAQTPQSQINPQLPQTATLPVAGASADVTYASVAQQSTDLIGTPVRDVAWGERIGDRVVMMAGNHLKQAEIRLTPAELGPLRVQVSVDDGATHVTFHAQHAVTRDALEQALPRLREMLAENGLSLGQADVSERGVDEGGSDKQSEQSALDSIADDAHGQDQDAAADLARRPNTSNGLLDTFV
ncbi:MAG: flagellar hook-length control protein FliK [Woeseiaceae bacterium]